MDLSLNQTVLWRREYGNKGIPSSFREEASGSVRELLAFLHEQGVQHGRVVDIGAGTGRNSIFLADAGYDVVSMELVPDLVEELRHRTASRRSGGTVTALQHDVTTPWPVADQSIDVAVDTFCYKHQVADASKRVYRDELTRVLKPSGYFLLTLAGRDDGYYASLLDASPDPVRHVIVDPMNQIPSILYSRVDIEDEFTDGFALARYCHKQRHSLMHGTSYNRSTHLFIFQRRFQRHKET